MDRRKFIITTAAATAASVISPIVLKSETPELPNELTSITAIWSDKYQTWFSYYEIDLTNKGFAFLNKISDRLSFCAVNGDSLDVHMFDYERDGLVQNIPLFKPELKKSSQYTLECIEAHCDDAGSTKDYIAVSFKYGELIGGIVI